MKHRMIFLLALVTLCGYAGIVLAAVGRTAGQFVVSSTGGAQYSIPLWTPPGMAKLQEHLALTYSSQRGDGLLGVGWAVAGLSAIRRCNMTYAQDGAPSAPQLITTDRLCLDGKRLRLTSSESLSTYGQPGTTYQTEVADFSNITAQGSAGNGPEYFTVQTRNGMTYEYGNTTDSRILANGGALSSATTWALDKITDPSGNSIHFTYTNDTAHNTYRISDIEYPYSSAGGPYYDVHFTYSARPTNDTLTHYVIGYAATETERLSEIDINLQASGWQLQKKYVLSYSSGSTNRTRISQIQECGPSDCLAATAVLYQNATAAMGSEVSTGQTPPYVANSFVMDMNGDGVADFVYPDTTTNTYWVMLGSTTGLTTPVNTNVSCANYEGALPLDFNNDGKMDLLIPNSSGNWRILESTGTTFTVIDTTVTATGAGGNAWVGDVDGDGRPDLIYTPNPGSLGSTLMVIYNSGSNNNMSFSGTPVQVYQLNPTEEFLPTGDNGTFSPVQQTYLSQIQFADFDGDGRIDIVVQYMIPSGGGQYEYGMRVLLSRGTSYILGYELGEGNFVQPIIGDFNGDGYADILYAPIRGYYSVLWGTGIGGTGTNGAALVVGPNTTIAAGREPVVALDWDGDGRTDLVYVASNGTSLDWFYALSTGTQFAAGVDTGVAADSEGNPYVADINGDGLPDLIYPNGNYVIEFRLHPGVVGDLSNSITDGYGNSVSPTYASIAQREVAPLF